MIIWTWEDFTLLLDMISTGRTFHCLIIYNRNPPYDHVVNSREKQGKLS